MTRQRYTINLRPDTPLLVSGTHTVGNYRSSATVVPGRTVRGAVAALLERQDKEAYTQIFGIGLDEQPHFGALIPAGTEAPDATVNPPTMFRCKSNNEHIYDTLIRQYVGEVVLDLLPEAVVEVDDLDCPECGESGDAWTVYDSLPGANLGISRASNFAKNIPVDVTRRSTTHVAINRQRHTAQPSQLYSREGFEVENTSVCLSGWLDLSAEHASLLQQALSGKTIRIGANRSRGMGKCEVLSVDKLALTFSLEERVRAFNESVAMNLQEFARKENIPRNEDLLPLQCAKNGLYFTLDLRSPALLFGHDGLPARDPETDLARIGASVERRWLRWDHIGGFHRAAGLPRRSQIGVWGTYLCRFDNDRPLDENLTALTHLETNGIGFMREQGFGQLFICHRAHDKID